jgi:hypothetical protein
MDHSSHILDLSQQDLCLQEPLTQPTPQEIRTSNSGHGEIQTHCPISECPAQFIGTICAHIETL